MAASSAGSRHVVTGDRQGQDPRGDALERGEHRGRVLRLQAGEQQHERQAVAPMLARKVGDEARGARDYGRRRPRIRCPRAGGRTAGRLELLQPRRPVVPAHRLRPARDGGTASSDWWRSMATASAALSAWCSPGRRGRGSVELALRVAIAELAASADDRVPVRPARDQQARRRRARPRRSARRCRAGRAWVTSGTSRLAIPAFSAAMSTSVSPRKAW